MQSVLFLCLPVSIPYGAPGIKAAKCMVEQLLHGVISVTNKIETVSQ